MRIFPISLLISMMLFALVAKGNEKADEITRIKAKDLCVALAMFKMDQHHWPTSEEGLNILTFPALNDHGESGDPYLSIIEKDPWGNDYLYRQNQKRFTLISMGGDGILNSSDDIGPNICYPEWTE